METTSTPPPVEPATENVTEMSEPAPAESVGHKTSFLRNIADTAIALPVAALVAHYTDLQLYALVIFGIHCVSTLAYAAPSKFGQHLKAMVRTMFVSVTLLAWCRVDNPWPNLCVLFTAFLMYDGLQRDWITSRDDYGSDPRLMPSASHPCALLGVDRLNPLYLPRGRAVSVDRHGRERHGRHDRRASFHLRVVGTRDTRKCSAH
ncbi:hypothetical protein FI667_g10422, partial [Globisporangium splendens]